MKDMEATVYVVDDNPGVREGLSILIESVGLRVAAFADVQEFLQTYDRQHGGCLILDIRLPGMSGTELMENAAAYDLHLPIIMLTGHGDVPTAVRTIKAGAFDFIEKPFHEQELLDCIQQAIRRDAANRRTVAQKSDIEAGLATLTPREREVIDLVSAGETTKSIALTLGLSPKTIDFHRAKAMEKLGAISIADLVRKTLLVSEPGSVAST